MTHGTFASSLGGTTAWPAPSASPSPNSIGEPLWRHQIAEADHTYEPGWFQLWDPRTGKTRPAVLKIARWILAGSTRNLVVAPKSACPVWGEELGRFDPERVRIVLFHDEDDRFVRCTAHKKCRVLLPTDTTKALLADLSKETRPIVFVVNRSVLYSLVQPHGHVGPLRKWRPTSLTLDESHEYKTPSADCSRAALMVSERCMFRLALTGTPDPESYVDYYGQFKIICPGWLAKNKREFDTRFVDYHFIFKNKVEGYRNTDELRALIFAKASRVRQDECFDMPAVRDIIVPIPFSRTVRELYNEITKNAVADFFGIDINATHQLTRLLILHQLCAGFIRHADGSVEWVSDAKIKTAVERIGELVEGGKRAVLYYHYRPEGERLEAALKKAFGAERVMGLHGGTKVRAAAPFREWPKMRVFVAQEDTANLAISLRESDHVEWTSWGPKSDVHYQARQRTFDDAKDKPHGLTYSYYEVPESADGFMREVIRKKRSASAMLLDVGFERAAYWGAK